MSNIFEEAIADARKLKEVAEENAKKAILESITPQIREFIEEQLLEGEGQTSEQKTCSECGHVQEVSESDATCSECNSPMMEVEADSESDEDLNEEIYLDESALASLVGLIGENALDSLNESKSKEALLSAVKGAVASMPNGDREQLINLSHKLNESAELLSDDRNNKGERMSRKYYEVDLRALREAVEEEADHLDEMEEADLMQELSALFEQDEEDLEAPEGGEDEFALPEEGEELEDEEGEDLPRAQVEDEIRGLIDALGLDIGAEAEEEEELELPEEGGEEGEELPEEELEALAESFDLNPYQLKREMKRIMRESKDAKQSKVAHHFGGKGGGKAGVKGAFGGAGNKKAGVKGAFGGGLEGQDAFVNPPQINKLNEAIRQLRRQNRAQTEKLNKYRGAVNSLREQLEDLNLFNAKLLYVNKLLQNKSLNESQKKSVIKALDEAQSLQEAKSLYSSLTETLSRSSDKATLSESRILGSSSRATTSSQSGATSTNNELSRWQRLAGL